MKKLYLISLAFLLFLIWGLVRVQADEFHDVEKEIEELKEKIDEAQERGRTLKSEIAAMDGKIRLKELEVQETEERINLLGEEIESLTDKIERMEFSLTRLSEVLLNRIVATYKANRISYLPVLLGSVPLSDALSRVKYIELVQQHDREVMTDIQSTKLDFTEKKELREQKKDEQEALKAQLEIQKAALDQEKTAKEALLEQTKNDENEYQRLLAQALAEKQALEAALVSGEKVGEVKKGEPIALVGNTGYPGCSTGKHLHFEVRKDNQWVNAADYLKSRTVEDHQDGGTSTIGGGDWDWPIDGDVIVTQHYGKTPYSWRYAYSGGIHTGIDMYSKSSDVIRAPKDGTLYAAEQGCGSSSIIKIKYIEHGDGVISFYLHVQ